MKTEAEVIGIHYEELAEHILKMLFKTRRNSTFLKSIWKARGLTTDDFERLQPQCHRETSAAVALIMRRFSDAKKNDYQEITALKTSLTEDLHFPEPFTQTPQNNQ